MVSNEDKRPLVLVVDDEEDVADTYALRLETKYETRIAYGGEQALEKIDEDVDAVLLDRRMPDIHGDDVLDEFRQRGYDCPIIMSTAVDPDLNILEMDFDDYLCKPIFRETLLDTLDQHLDTDTSQDEQLNEFLSLVAKIDILEEELTHAELAESEQYQECKERADELAPTLRDRVENFEEILETYRDIEREA